MSDEVLCLDDERQTDRPYTSHLREREREREREKGWSHDLNTAENLQGRALQKLPFPNFGRSPE
jgi:hypothetical protein